VSPPAPAPREELPTRWQAALFLAKAWCFRIQRAVRDPHGRPRRLDARPVDRSTPVLAEARSPLFGSASSAEFALQAGKVQNLRAAARFLNGRMLGAGEVFGFWANVPRPVRAKGFARGRELREGCVIPSFGGGLCQLSNALYQVALEAGCEIVERHAHSRRLPDSAAALGRDATIFWNYVDLRFRVPADAQLEVAVESSDLVVRLRGHSGPARPLLRVLPARPGAARDAHETEAESCETCGAASCFRRPDAWARPREATRAWLVDAFSPEAAAYLSQQRRADDVLFVPLDGRRWRTSGYRWATRGFAAVHQAPAFVLRRSLRSRRLASQGAARQTALLKADEELARIFARRLPEIALHLVVSQSLLPFLWRDGHLGGRSFDVLMTRLPLSALEARLDRASARWPEARTLRDFRAPRELAAAEDAALAAAQHWITPHSGIAALAAERAVRLDWKLPDVARRSPGRRVVLPTSTLARKGACELRELAKELSLPITVAGPLLEEPDFWSGCDVRRAGEDWLADAAVVVEPAWVEHSPRRLLAAVAAGIPVIATPACGLAAVPGVRTVPEGDLAALAECLAQVSRVREAS
jgi:hypothetical protein